MDDERWLAVLWAQVDKRDRAMYAKRLAGDTLHEISERHGLTQERVRQRLVNVDKQVASAADRVCPDWRKRLARFALEPAVSTSAAAAALGVRDSDAVSVLLRAVGFVAPRVWGRVVRPNLWTARPGALDTAFEHIVAAAPLRPDELSDLALTERLPSDLPLSVLLADSRSPLIQGADGSWLRRSGRSRDAAYLWMAEHGSPCRVEDLAAVLGDIRPHALREALRRDERFAQIRPEGTWVLTEWSHPGVTPYSSAVEAMVAVLEEEGPVSKDHLFARVTARYPVTTWRLQQCLLILQ